MNSPTDRFRLHPSCACPSACKRSSNSFQASHLPSWEGFLSCHQGKRQECSTSVDLIHHHDPVRHRALFTRSTAACNLERNCWSSSSNNYWWMLVLLLSAGWSRQLPQVESPFSPVKSLRILPIGTWNVGSAIEIALTQSSLNRYCHLQVLGHLRYFKYMSSWIDCSTASELPCTANTLKTNHSALLTI